MFIVDFFLENVIVLYSFIKNKSTHFKIISKDSKAKYLIGNIFLMNVIDKFGQPVYGLV